jgi:fatty-acyl-CoA synthase
MPLEPQLERLRALPELSAEATRRAPAFAALRAFGPAGLLRARARWHPHRDFLRTPTARLTWGEAHAAVEGLARALAARGIQAGQCVAVVLGNRFETLLVPLALSRLGATSALVNPALEGAPLAHALRAAKVRAVLTDAEHRGALDALAPAARQTPEGAAWPLWSLDGAEALVPVPGKPLPLRRDRGAVPLTHLFTSGTTGLPKAAPVYSARLSLAAMGLQSFALRSGADDVFFTPLPLFHASAWAIGFLPALLAGSGFATAPRFSARRYFEDAAATGATIGVYVGEMCRYLLEGAPQPPAHHRLRTFVGNGLSAGVWSAFVARFGGPRIVEFYGATEGNAFLLNRNGKVGSCGRPMLVGPLDGLRLVRYDVATDSHPRDALGRLVLCEAGEAGELIGRIGLLPSERFDGYLDPLATAKKILPDGFVRGDRWFRTGDLLRRDEEGDYFFVDRIGDTFRWKGENVSTQEVADTLRSALEGAENTANSAEGAQGAAAGALAGPLVIYGVQVKGHEGRAGMLALTGPPPTSEDLRTLWRAAQRLPTSARPAFVRHLAAPMDTTATLKWQRTRLQAEGHSGCGTDGVWVRDDAVGTYAPFDASRAERLAAGALRL